MYILKQCDGYLPCSLIQKILVQGNSTLLLIIGLLEEGKFFDADYGQFLTIDRSFFLGTF
jgi:hypothetical protein